MNPNQCPKCGRGPVFYADVVSYGWKLICPDCGLETDCCANRDEAIAKWNELTNKHSNKKSEVRNEAT